MPTKTKPRLSRWGHSVYERPEQIAKEPMMFADWVDVVEPYADAEIVVVHSKQWIGEAELLQLPSVKMVITTTSGFEHLDWRRMHERGIIPVRMPLLRRDAVVESILGMLLHANRRQWQFHMDAQNNEWTRHKLTEYEPLRIQDQKIAVVGLGVIGTKLCELLSGLGAEMFGVDPNGIPANVHDVNPIGFDALPRQVDVTLLACTHNDTTHKMVNSTWLQQCRNMTLVNCARGKLVDLDAALQAIDCGQLQFLGLDVFPQEPFLELKDAIARPNILCTPHAAGYHPNLGVQIQEQLLNIVQRWVNEEPIPFVVGQSVCGVGNTC